MAGDGDLSGAIANQFILEIHYKECSGLRIQLITASHFVFHSVRARRRIAFKVNLVSATSTDWHVNRLLFCVNCNGGIGVCIWFWSIQMGKMIILKLSRNDHVKICLTVDWPSLYERFFYRVLGGWILGTLEHTKINVVCKFSTLWRPHLKTILRYITVQRLCQHCRWVATMACSHCPSKRNRSIKRNPIFSTILFSWYQIILKIEK